MNRLWPTAVAAMVVWFHAVSASAQIQLVPAEMPRHDFSVQAGWTSVDSGGDDVSNQRFDAGAFNAAFGILLTRHLKAVIGAGLSGESSTFSTTVRTPPGSPQPIYSFSEHRFDAETVDAAIGYQFFENRWVHPTIAAGVQLARETHRIDLQGPFTDRPPVVSSSTVDELRVRPLVRAGLKFYMAERAFIRTNIDVTLSARGAQRVTWATGVGFDF